MNIDTLIKRHIRDVADFPKQGIDFKDISGIFSQPDVSRQVIEAFRQHAQGEIDVVCGVESRGFIFGFPIALALHVPFVLVRKKGKLPPPTKTVFYDLEYGSAALEIVEGQIPPNSRVMIHDDVLATGGTANAAAELVNSLGATVTQFSFLIELSFLHGKDKLPPIEVVSLAKY